jgi:hypothetical protein
MDRLIDLAQVALCRISATEQDQCRSRPHSSSKRRSLAARLNSRDRSRGSLNPDGLVVMAAHVVGKIPYVDSDFPPCVEYRLTRVSCTALMRRKAYAQRTREIIRKTRVKSIARIWEALLSRFFDPGATSCTSWRVGGYQGCMGTYTSA